MTITSLLQNMWSSQLLLFTGTKLDCVIICLENDHSLNNNKWPISWSFLYALLLSMCCFLLSKCIKYCETLWILRVLNEKVRIGAWVTRSAHPVFSAETWQAAEPFLSYYIWNINRSELSVPYVHEQSLCHMLISEFSNPINPHTHTLAHIHILPHQAPILNEVITTVIAKEIPLFDYSNARDDIDTKELLLSIYIFI